MSLIVDSRGYTVDSAQAELMCDISDCPAHFVRRISIFDQDFKFCQHHLDELEPSLIMLDQNARVLA